MPYMYTTISMPESCFTKRYLYLYLVYTKTVDSLQGPHRLASHTPNILCYLPPSNSRKNGVPVCIHDK